MRDNIPTKARRRQDFHAPAFDPAARTICLWRLETLAGVVVAAASMPTLWAALWLTVRICG